MAITNGMTGDYSDIVVNDTPFYLDPHTGLQLFSTYITVGTTGNIVWRNRFGELQYLANVSSGSTVAISATEIVQNGIVRGIPRTTSAANLTWIASLSIN